MSFPPLLHHLADAGHKLFLRMGVLPHAEAGLVVAEEAAARRAADGGTGDGRYFLRSGTGRDNDVHVKQSAEGMRVLYANGDALGLKRRKGRQQICLKTRGEVAHLKRGSGEGGAQGIAGGTGYGQGKRVALLRTGHDDGEAYKRLRRMLAQQLQLVLPAGIPGGEYGGEIIQCS